MTAPNRPRGWPALFIALLATLLAACNQAADVAGTPVSRLAEGSATVALLPTPTLAAPGGGDLPAPAVAQLAVTPTADILRPPTPVVLPSATPPGEAGAEPAAGEAPIEVAGEAQAPTDAPPPTPALPPDATPLELFALGRESSGGRFSSSRTTDSGLRRSSCVSGRRWRRVRTALCGQTGIYLCGTLPSTDS